MISVTLTLTLTLIGGHDIEFEMRSMLWCITTEEQWKYAVGLGYPLAVHSKADDGHSKNRTGYCVVDKTDGGDVSDVLLLSGDDARLEEPLLGPSVIGAVKFPMCGVVHPRKVMFAMKKEALDAGVIFIERTEVTAGASFGASKR